MASGDKPVVHPSLIIKPLLIPLLLASFIIKNLLLAILQTPDTISITVHGFTNVSLKGTKTLILSSQLNVQLSKLLHNGSIIKLIRLLPNLLSRNSKLRLIVLLHIISMLLLALYR